MAVRHRRDKKRRNAIAAMCCRTAPALLINHYSASVASWPYWLLGFTAGLIWGNGFEYIYHRWLLHRPRTPLGSGHLEHHSQIGTPEEAEHVALISSPANVVLLFVINGVPAFLAASLMGVRGILCGVFIGWSVYLIATEEIHWRIHMKGWLPPGLGSARAYHMSHHDVPNSRYNVFLPFFDFVFESRRPAKNRVPV
jgi:hypothetical protein